MEDISVKCELSVCVGFFTGRFFLLKMFVLSKDAERGEFSLEGICHRKLVAPQVTQ